MIPLRSATTAAALLLSAALAHAQQDLPADPSAPDSPLPAEPGETGGLLHILPGRTDPVTLPSGSAPGSGSLFPPQLWPAAPPPAAEPAHAPASAPTGESDTDMPASPWSRECLLADPFGTLGSITRAHLAAILDSGTAKSGIALHCLIVPDSTSLPDSWNPAAWIETSYPDQPAIAAIIPVTAPGQAQLHPSRSAAIQWIHREQSATVAACASAASAVPGPDASISRFLLRLLTEINSARPAEPNPSAPVPAPHEGFARWWLTIVASQFLAIGLGALWWRTRQRRQAARSPLVLSVLPSTPRLGAPYCGGHSASVRFPPAKPSA